MSDSELEDFYKSEYRILQQGQSAPTPIKLQDERRRARHLAGILESQLAYVSSHLDIGCAAGELLRAIRETFHPDQSLGVEPSDEYRKSLSASGIQAVARIEDIDRTRGFGLITMSHVLEHFPNPVKTLRYIRISLLRPGGHLLVEVPNLFVHTSFEIAHLVSFSRLTLQETLRRAGFRPTFTKIHHEPRPVDRRGHYVTMLAYPDPLISTDIAPCRITPGMVRLCRRVRQSTAALVISNPIAAFRTLPRRLGWVNQPSTTSEESAEQPPPARAEASEAQ